MEVDGGNNDCSRGYAITAVTITSGVLMGMIVAIEGTVAMIQMVLVAMAMTTSDGSHDPGRNDGDSDKCGSGDERGDIDWLAMTVRVSSFQAVCAA